MPQAMKIWYAKVAVDKEWKKARDNSSIGFEKSQEQKGGHPGGAKRQHESPLCFIDGHVPPCGTYKTFFWDGKTPFERRCGEPFRGTVIPCGAMVGHHSISAETSQGSINLARKF